MKLSDLKTLLRAHAGKPFRLVLPDRNAVPVSFHITEVAHVEKRFIDCGGRMHTSETCQLQAWLGPDSDHRLNAGKMADILDRSQAVLPEGRDLDIEIEYEDTSISQYPVVSHSVTDEAIFLYLSRKHTDCLAKDVCLAPDSVAAGGAAGDSPGCCG